MTTCSDLIENVRVLTAGGVNDDVNRLAQPYTPGDTTITLQYEPRGFGQGTRFSAGLNTFLSWNVAVGAREVECQGGVEGSIDSALPAGTIVRVRPRITDHSALTLLNNDIQRISAPGSGLFAVGTWNPIVDPVDQAWTVPIEHLGMERILAIRFTPAGQPDRWLEANGTLRVSGGEKRLVMDTMLSASDTVEVTYGKPFSILTSLDDDVEVLSGLAPDMVPIPVYGAAAALSMSQESRRNMLLAQSDTRRPDEVPSGALTGVAREFFRQRQVHLDMALTRLQREYPYRRVLPFDSGW